ncbi:hypothetical protein LSAT2_019056 [Lamellibrachia satsuma]|nr:hypothetical protein LSAT2_019056 [Lamellibrachia satsuma]
MKRSRCVRCRLCGDWKHNVIIVNTFLCIVGASVSGVGVGLQSELSQDWQLLLNRFPLGPFGRAPILVQPSVFEMCANAVTCTGGFIVVSSLYAIFVAAFEWETMLTAVRNLRLFRASILYSFSAKPTFWKPTSWNRH